MCSAEVISHVFGFVFGFSSTESKTLNSDTCHSFLFTLVRISSASNTSSTKNHIQRDIPLYVPCNLVHSQSHPKIVDALRFKTCPTIVALLISQCTFLFFQYTFF